jgi:hypothetical protein
MNQSMLAAYSRDLRLRVWVRVGVKCEWGRGWEWGWKGSFSFQNLIRTLVRKFRRAHLSYTQIRASDREIMVSKILVFCYWNSGSRFDKLQSGFVQTPVPSTTRPALSNSTIRFRIKQNMISRSIDGARENLKIIFRFVWNLRVPLDRAG